MRWSEATEALRKHSERQFAHQCWQQFPPLLQRQYFRVATEQHLQKQLSFFVQNTQQHIKSALHAVDFNSVLVTPITQARTRL